MKREYMELPFSEKYKLNVIHISGMVGDGINVCKASEVEERLKTLSHALSYCSEHLPPEKSDVLAKILLAQL